MPSQRTLLVASEARSSHLGELEQLLVLLRTALPQCASPHRQPTPRECSLDRLLISDDFIRHGEGAHQDQV